MASEWAKLFSFCAHWIGSCLYFLKHTLHLFDNKGRRPQAFNGLFYSHRPLIFCNSGRNGLKNDILIDQSSKVKLEFYWKKKISKRIYKCLFFHLCLVFQQNTNCSFEFWSFSISFFNLFLPLLQKNQGSGAIKYIIESFGTPPLFLLLQGAQYVTLSFFCLCHPIQFFRF